jgi:hypothetical protein
MALLFEWRGAVAVDVFDALVATIRLGILRHYRLPAKIYAETGDAAIRKTAEELTGTETGP